MSLRRNIRRMAPLVLLAVFVAFAVVLVLGKVPVGIEYGSPYRGMPDAATNGIDIVSAARGQIGVTFAYDPAYRNIPYPNGDVPMDRGVCSDVIVRALRTARGIDLQRLVHEDMKAHFVMYPSLTRWQLLRPDPNIDHRRVLNLERFFGRSGWSLEVTKEKDCYFPGDIVTCLIGGEIPHVMIVSDRKSSDGVPLVIHNVGSGTQEEDCLFSYEITGHHRLNSCAETNHVDTVALDCCLSNVCSSVSATISSMCAQAQMQAFCQWLVHDLDAESFADVYAQTIVYGMFAARFHDTTPEDFSRAEAATLIPRTNPLLCVKNKGCVYINSTQCFDNVPTEAWEFFVGGYQPAQKWLKDRKGRTLASDDIMHYKAVIAALVETQRLMDDLEKTKMEGIS